jgi:Secretion system C-terminal sorting domain
MKNFYFLLIFSFLLQNITAQSVQWFAPGAHWEYFYLTNGSTGFSSMYIDSTVILGGENCFKLTGYDRGYDYIHSQNLNEEILPIYAFSRNDSVFLWSSDHFEVLYDFTRQVGDTILITAFYDYAILKETGDTLLWNGITTRYQKWEKYNVNFSKTAYIFEGLGGESFNYWKFISPGAELESKITCYRDDAHPLPTCDFTYTPDYQAFPTGYGSWHEEEHNWCFSNGKEYIQYGGDTTIVGIGTGKKIWWRKNFEASDPCPNEFFNQFNNPPEFLGILEQDFFNKKVWFTRINPNLQALPILAQFYFPQNQRVILYDFNLQTGDTLHWMPSYNVFSHNDSLLLPSGQWRKTYYFQDYFGVVDPNNFWIEGIGAFTGLFGSYSPPISDTWGFLNCHEGFLGTGFQSYYRLDSQSCIVNVPIYTKEPDFSSKIHLSPNPVTDFFTLDLPSEILPADLSITDILGRRINSFSQTETSQRFDFQGDRLDSGLYFLEIKGKNGVTLSRKFVY